MTLADGVVHALEVTILLVGRTDFPHALERLLNIVGNLEARGLGLLAVCLKDFARAKEQGKRNWNAPQARERKTPVVDHHHHGDDGRGDVATIEVAQYVAPHVFEAINVAHHGLGKLRKIAMGEERERELAKTLGEVSAYESHLVIDQRVGVVVLLVVSQEREDEEDNDPGYVRQCWRQVRTVHERRHEPLHEQIEKADTAHNEEVGHYRPEDALLDVGLPRFGQRILLAKFLTKDHLTPPPSRSSTALRSGSQPTYAHTTRPSRQARCATLARRHGPCQARRCGRR